MIVPVTRYAPARFGWIGDGFAVIGVILAIPAGILLVGAPIALIGWALIKAFDRIL
ncbi:MAG: hypothetical protein M3R55_04690 [Acidobacteriota bacterium]|nr:hypothetical protein [Acidobacteriota bacterium]